ncbi:MAG: DUF3473 domain-containing protein [Bacteroidia bacterium]|nr:DUF3473 domain-containing protein [Bacteroidia bacterium]
MSIKTKASVAFSVDFEDWFQGIEIPMQQWEQYEPRLEKGTQPLLDMLEKNQVRATFFALGYIARKNPEWIKTISSKGHELASHGYSHEKVYNLTPAAFREEIATTKKLIEDLTGKPVLAYRAPYFSITSDSLWALEVLAEEGYTIDCSISPIKTWRYGIANCPDEIFYIPEVKLIEFPVSPFKILTKRLAIGGAYFRLFPYFLTRNGIRSRVENNQPTMFYIHPWEYDPKHPVVDIHWKAKITHYTGLTNTIPFTQKLLQEFSFKTVSELVQDYGGKNSYKNISLSLLKD